nr:hypothetical protein [uncultured Desulfobacter sp.]
MIRIKPATDAPNFKSPSRHANGSIFVICNLWRNTEGGLKSKQMGDSILIIGLMIVGKIIGYFELTIAQTAFVQTHIDGTNIK